VAIANVLTILKFIKIIFVGEGDLVTYIFSDELNNI
jgi:hypothetical protein